MLSVLAGRPRQLFDGPARVLATPADLREAHNCPVRHLSRNSLENKETNDRRGLAALAENR